MTDQRIAIEIMALFASLGDSHSVMAPFGMRKGALDRLPLHLYAFADGVFVIDAPDAHRGLIGGRLLDIGGKTVEQLRAGLRPYLSRDNDAFLRYEIPFALTLPDLLAVLGSDARGDEVVVKVQKSGGTTTARVRRLKGPLDPEQLPLKLIPPRTVPARPPLYLARLKEPFWLEPVDRDLLYAQMNQCRDHPGKTLDQFAREIDRAVRKGKPRDLVLDVRLNNGGNYEATFAVARSLVAFRKSRADARLFVIMGRNTLSAAQDFIGLLDQLCEPIFVGEPSGSKPNHVGDDTEVVLPYSGILGSIACACHQTNFRDARAWIAPRIPVALTSRSYFRQEDPAMEAIRAFRARP